MPPTPKSPYRQLQQRAKSIGVPARGTFEELSAAVAAVESGAGGAPKTPKAAPKTPKAKRSPPAEKPSSPNKFVSTSTEPPGGGYDGGISLWPDGLAGISAKGLFNAIPGWVDSKLPPGHTSQVSEESPSYTHAHVPVSHGSVLLWLWGHAVVS
jgi:hypothetical protein